MRKIISETPITSAEVKEALEKIKEKDKELNFRAQKTEEYLQQVITIKPKKAKELYAKLEKLNISRLRDIQLTKLVDAMPITETDVKTILQGYVGVTVKKDDMKKITDTIAEFV